MQNAGLTRKPESALRPLAAGRRQEQLRRFSLLERFPLTRRGDCDGLVLRRPTPVQAAAIPPTGVSVSPRRIPPVGIRSKE
ncbi:MAG: hypothetical protein DMG27_06730 [Acidobacteria bacterium]|nr:MAG: hypothetical protein DMG27_06730 [Acidobacteriota bacterium]